MESHSSVGDQKELVKRRKRSGNFTGISGVHKVEFAGMVSMCCNGRTSHRNPNASTPSMNASIPTIELKFSRMLSALSVMPSLCHISPARERSSSVL